MELPPETYRAIYINKVNCSSNFSTIAERSRDGWPVPDAVITVICAPDDGWSYNPKYFEQFTEIK